MGDIQGQLQDINLLIKVRRTQYPSKKNINRSSFPFSSIAYLLDEQEGVLEKCLLQNLENSQIVHS